MAVPDVRIKTLIFRVCSDKDSSRLDKKNEKSKHKQQFLVVVEVT